MTAPTRTDGPDDLRGRWPYVAHVAAAVLVFGAYLYAVREVLSPFVLWLLVLFVASPWFGTRWYATFALAATGLFVLWLLRTTGTLLAPFVLAILLAYILDPWVDRLERRRVPRAWAILALAAPVLGALVLGAAVGLPAVGRHVSGFVAGLVPPSLEAVRGWWDGVRAWVAGLGIPGLDARTLPGPETLDPQAIVAFLNERRALIAERAWRAVLGFGRGVGVVLTALGYLVLTPVLTYYLLRDYDRWTRGLAEIVPPQRRERWIEFVREYDGLLARYLRGQVLVAACVGALTGIGFWIAGFPYALLLGAVAGIFNVVPYLGLLASLVPALAIAFASESVVWSLVKVAIVFGAVNVLESAVLSPRIVGGSVGLHPVWVLLSLAVFGFFFGFVGLLLAVPIAVFLKVLWRRAWRTLRASAYYAPPAPAP